MRIFWTIQGKYDKSSANLAKKWGEILFIPFYMRKISKFLSWQENQQQASIAQKNYVSILEFIFYHTNNYIFFTNFKNKLY